MSYANDWQRIRNVVRHSAPELLPALEVALSAVRVANQTTLDALLNAQLDEITRQLYARYAWPGTDPVVLRSIAERSWHVTSDPRTRSSLERVMRLCDELEEVDCRQKIERLLRLGSQSDPHGEER